MKTAVVLALATLGVLAEIGALVVSLRSPLTPSEVVKGGALGRVLVVGTVRAAPPNETPSGLSCVMWTAYVHDHNIMSTGPPRPQRFSWHQEGLAGVSIDDDKTKLPLSPRLARAIPDGIDTGCIALPAAVADACPPQGNFMRCYAEHCAKQRAVAVDACFDGHELDICEGDSERAPFLGWQPGNIFPRRFDGARFAVLTAGWTLLMAVAVAVARRRANKV